jgi:uncharacterized protein (TIGR03435 family)
MISKIAALGFVFVEMAMGQTATAPPRGYAFDAVSIRRTDPSAFARPRQISADGYRVTRTTLLWEIEAAFVPQEDGAVAFREDDVKGYPSWVATEYYDIDARVSEADMPEWQKRASQPAMLRAMLQQMLVDQCKLAVHREFKERDIYALVVAKGGPKLKPSDPDSPHPAGIDLPGGGVIVTAPGLVLYGVTLNSFVMFLSQSVHQDRPIVDKTGLPGRYDIVLATPKSSADSASDEDGAAASDGGPAPFSFLKKFGLAVVPTKGTVETLVIDHIERPSEN